MLRRSRILPGFLCAGLLGALSGNLYAIAPINTSSRAAVVSAYNSVYVHNLEVAAGWNGNVAGCNAGTTTAAYQQATIDNANFYRALTGLPSASPISDPNVINRAQQAALIMSAQSAATGITLSHTPPASWSCYSAAGYEGASGSNLSIGWGSGPGGGSFYAGPGAIDGYISDPQNASALGHRRWVLYQSQTGFATGDIVDANPGTFSSNALRVMPGTNPATGATVESSNLFWSTPATKNFVVWPSPNFVPYPLMPIDTTVAGNPQYWSISYPGANFNAATVTVTDQFGGNVTLSARTPLPTGYGDNTLLFSPDIPVASYTSGMADTSYKVEIAGVGGGGPASYCYTVTVIDPAMSGTDAAPDLCSATPGLTAQTITFTSNPPSPALVGGSYTVTATGGASSNPVSFAAGPAGVCSISGSAVSFDGTGTCNITADQAGDAAYAAAAQKVQSFTIGAKSDQTIHFGATPPATVTAGASYTISATASSGLGVALSLDAASTACTLSGSAVSFTSAGACIVNADQSGNASFNPAPQATLTFAVLQASQTITFPVQTTLSRLVTDAPFQIDPLATASSGLQVSYSVTGVCTISGTTITLTGTAGTCTIAADQAGNPTGIYAPAPTVTQNIAVGLTAQVIAFTTTPPANAAVGGPPYTPAATGGGSGNAVTFTVAPASASVCAIAAGAVTFTGPGACTIIASQAGDAAYADASPVQQSFTVKATQTIVFPSQTPASRGLVVGGPFPLTPVATASSNLPITYSSLTTSVCTVSGATVTMLATGTCTIAADQGGNASYAAATQVTQNINILAAQIITFTSTPPANPAVGDTYTVTATGGGSSNAVVLTIDAASASVCSIDGAGVVTFNSSGTCIVDANQAGDITTYAAASQVQQSITVKAAQTITFPAQTPASQGFVLNGTFQLNPVATASSNLQVNYSSLTTGVCTVSGRTVTMRATGVCTIAADQPGNAAYAAAPQVTQNIAILTRQIISFTSTPPVNPAVGDTYTVTATGGGSGNAVTFSLDPASTSGACALDTTTGVVTFTATAGSCIIDANQAGDASYAAAAQVQHFIVLGPRAAGGMPIPALDPKALGLLAALLALAFFLPRARGSRKL